MLLRNAYIYDFTRHKAQKNNTALLTAVRPSNLVNDNQSVQKNVFTIKDGVSGLDSMTHCITERGTSVRYTSALYFHAGSYAGLDMQLRTGRYEISTEFCYGTFWKTVTLKSEGIER
jgi:hypothetical protein